MSQKRNRILSTDHDSPPVAGAGALASPNEKPPAAGVGAAPPKANPAGFDKSAGLLASSALGAPKLNPPGAAGVGAADTFPKLNPLEAGFESPAGAGAPNENPPFTASANH